MKYSRQEKLDVLPKDIQKIIQDKKIILVGCGGVGSPLAELLVRGGFLKLKIIDFDVIDYSNLQRQTYFEEDVAKGKSKTLKEKLEKINKDASIEYLVDTLSEENIEKICCDADLIVDATDNFEIRKIINKFCENNNKDWVYNGAIKTESVSCIFKGKDKLFNKIFPKQVKEESCCQVGVLASTTHITASIAYNQILKYFIGEKTDEMIKFDSWKNKFFNIKIK